LVNRKSRKLDWAKLTIFYEDSEGDLNVIKEVNDFKAAQTYIQAKNLHYLKCSIVDRDTYFKIRDEQDKSALNRSRTYEN
jgi:hypothetical protein